MSENNNQRRNNPIDNKEEKCIGFKDKLFFELDYFKTMLLTFSKFIILLLSLFFTLLIFTSPFPIWIDLLITITFFIVFLFIYSIARILTYIPKLKISRRSRTIFNYLIISSTIPIVGWGINNSWINNWEIGNNLLGPVIAFFVLLFIYITGQFLKSPSTRELILETLNLALSNIELHKEINISDGELINELKKKESYSFEEFLDNVGDFLQLELNTSELCLTPKKIHKDLFRIIIDSTELEANEKVIVKLKELQNDIREEEYIQAILHFNQLLAYFEKHVSSENVSSSELGLFVEKKERGNFGKKINAMYLFILTIISILQLLSFLGIISFTF